MASKSPEYDAYKAHLAQISRERAAAGREIGEIPDIADVRRRSRCRLSLHKFCETYNPEAFSLAWSGDQLRAIKRIEEAATLGALYALAMPRGSGKSTICRMAALWAISYGHCRYVFVIGANAAKAEDTLAAVKTFVRFLPEYGADFPEVAFPAQCLGGIANRSAGQTCGDESTLIEWAKDRVVLPTVPPPANWPKKWPLRADGKVPTSGAVVSAAGLTGEGIRGSLLTLSTGEMVRPDLVLLDDPQTSESAFSPTQNATREHLVGADVLGMAGPGKTIAAVMPCTVIAPADFVDRILDRSKHPLWRGERTRMLTTMPTDLAAWDGYFEVYRRCAQKEPPDYREAHAHYRANRAALDAGAEASWPARKLEGEVSAIQHAMNLYCRDRRAFWSEYQNEPLEESLAESRELKADDIARKLAGPSVPRLTVPRESTHLTAFVDCSTNLLWYAVAAWDERFNGCAIDYGAWPRQNRAYYEQADARPSLKDAFPGLSEPQRVYAGLDALTGEILGREYRRQETGQPVKVERCLVDANWQPGGGDPIYQFCRRSPWSALLLPSIGHASTSNRRPISEWKRLPGQRVGRDWRIMFPESGRGRRVVFDPDSWKTFLADRLLTPPGGAGCLQLYGDRPEVHQLLADHLTAEYATRVTVGTRTTDKWAVRPERRDNHLLDCLTGCAVAASVQGLAWTDGSTAEAPRAAGRPPAGGKKFSDMQREKMAARGAR